MDNRQAKEAAMHGRGSFMAGGTQHGDEDDIPAMDDAWAEKALKFARDRYGIDLTEDDLSQLWSMLPHRQKIEGEPHERDTMDGEPEARGQEESRQRFLERSEKQVASPRTRQNEEARFREHRDSEQSRDRMPSRGRNDMPNNRLAHDSDMEFIDQLLAQPSEVFVGGNSRSWRLEEAAQREVERIRKLAGVGSGMGLDAAQSRLRSERILNVTLQEQARRQRAEESLAKHFPEAARIGIQP
jgi:hypothetical protein